MGFRNPITSAVDLDTGVSAAPGVRIYASGSNPASGVVEWHAGAAIAKGTLTSSDTGSGGTNFTLSAAGNSLQLNSESQPAGGYASVARLNASLALLFGIPVAQARQTAAQNLASGAWTPLALDGTNGVDLNPGGWFGVAAGAPSRLVAPVHGIYEVAAVGQFAANATGRRGIRYNYSTTGVSTAVVSPDSVDAFLPAASNVTAVPAKPFLVELQPNGWVEVQLLQDSGATVATFVGSDSSSSVSIKLVTAL